MQLADTLLALFVLCAAFAGAATLQGAERCRDDAGAAAWQADTLRIAARQLPPSSTPETVRLSVPDDLTSLPPGFSAEGAGGRPFLVLVKKTAGGTDILVLAKGTASGNDALPRAAALRLQGGFYRPSDRRARALGLSASSVWLPGEGRALDLASFGLTAVPEAGDLFEAVEDERLARELAEQRIAAAKEKQFSAFQKVTLDNLFSQMAQNDMKELAIVVKADVQGSAEAVKQSLEKISNDEVRVRVIHAGVGAISKSDVDLADASNAIIIGFNVRPDNVAKEEAAATKVEMRMYRVIYDAINDVTDAMKGMLAPKFREVSLGELQVRQVYKISNVGTVAGCRVTSGKITRDSKVRVVRDGIVITEDEIASLKRFKDDAKEVAEGYECGVTLAKFADVKEGDVYEAFKMEEYRD